MRRHDLIGAATSEAFEVRVARAHVLLEDIVEPGWRHDPPILIHHSNIDGVSDVAGCGRETVNAGRATSNSAATSSSYVSNSPLYTDNSEPPGAD